MVVLLMFGLLLATGCGDALVDSSDLGATKILPKDGGKKKQWSLIDKATSPAGAMGKLGDASIGEVNLIVGLEDDGDVELFTQYYRILRRFRILRRYDYEEVFNGVAITLPADELDAFMQETLEDPQIAWIAPDFAVRMDPSLYKLAEGSGQILPWGVDRIGGATSIAASGDGQGRVEGVDLFVLDTGVRGGDLNVVEQKAFFAEATTSDLDGHGYHVATIAAATDDNERVVGVAPGVSLHSLKVFDDAGIAQSSEAIAALEYVVGQKQLHPNQPMVVNMSIGANAETSEYGALDLAVQSAISVGVVCVLSAGNDAADALTYTPAHVSEAITVGAYDLDNTFAWFSNFGATLDILAPGVDIPSMGLMNGNEVRVLSSGTSQAAAHVAGAAALFLSQNPAATPAQVRDALVKTAKPVVAGAPSGTTTGSVYVGADGGLTTVKVPGLFQYALVSGGDLRLAERVQVILNGTGSINASIFANKKLDLGSSSVLVGGFGYYGESVSSTATASDVFKPRYNPMGITAYQRVPAIHIPQFSAMDYVPVASRSSKTVTLRGNYALGTADAPMIWFIDGDIRTAGPVTFSGYGVLVATGAVDLKHDISAPSGAEATVGIFADKRIDATTKNIALAALLYSADEVCIEEGVKLLGNVTAAGRLELKKDAIVRYQPTSASLQDALSIGETPFGKFLAGVGRQDGFNPGEYRGY